MNTTEIEQTTDQKLTPPLQSLGFTLTVIAGPRGVIKPAQSKDGKPWPCLKFRVLLQHGGKDVLETDFSFGIGHVDLKKVKVPPSTFLPGWSNEETSFLAAWQRQPHAEFKDKALQARVTERLARLQKLAPTLPGVLSSLLMESDAHGQTFEDWCGEFGYDTDSRSAEETFRACELIGRQLHKVDAKTLEQAREILQDY